MLKVSVIKTNKAAKEEIIDDARDWMTSQGLGLVKYF